MNKKCRVGGHISRVYRKGGSFISDRLADYNIGSGQYTYMIHLGKHGDGINQEKLSEEVFIDKAMTARAMKKLENEGYIIRETDKNDKRSKLIYLTDKGKEVCKEVIKVIDEWNNILLDGFEEEEKEKAKEYLRRIWENAKKV